jgi:hypothetical protein
MCGTRRDSRGDLFQQKLAKLDIKDTNDKLVAPWDMQHMHRPGTIVVFHTTLVCWDVARGTSNARKVRSNLLSPVFLSANGHDYTNVYQVQAHWLKILHESDGPME